MDATGGTPMTAREPGELNKIITFFYTLAFFFAVGLALSGWGQFGFPALVVGPVLVLWLVSVLVLWWRTFLRPSAPPADATPHERIQQRVERRFASRALAAANAAMFAAASLGAFMLINTPGVPFEIIVPALLVWFGTVVWQGASWALDRQKDAAIAREIARYESLRASAENRIGLTDDGELVYNEGEKAKRED